MPEGNTAIVLDRIQAQVQELREMIGRLAQEIVQERRSYQAAKEEELKRHMDLQIKTTEALSALSASLDAIAANQKAIFKDIKSLEERMSAVETFQARQQGGSGTVRHWLFPVIALVFAATQVWLALQVTK